MFKTTPFEEIKVEKIYYNQLDSKLYQIHYIKKFSLVMVFNHIISFINQVSILLLCQIN